VWLDEWLSVAWGPVQGRFARAVTNGCAVWLSDCCLVWCAEQILERGRVRESCCEDEWLLDM
jgi:hypothetical protein